MTHNNDQNSDEFIKKIESLQIELQSNPKSLSFAQLADLYLAQNMIDEAENLLFRSLKYHPKSVSGHMLLGRVYQLKNNDSLALDELNICLQKAPSNWACYLLRAQIYLKLGNLKLALNDYKKVMLHNPKHTGVAKSISRLESLTANEYDDDLFEIKTLSDISTFSSSSKATEQNTHQIFKSNPKLDRALSLVDAFSARQEFNKAVKLLKECQTEYGNYDEIQTRLLRLSQYESVEKLRPKEAAHISFAKQNLILEKKENALKLLLRRIQESKISLLV